MPKKETHMVNLILNYQKNFILLILIVKKKIKLVNAFKDCARVN